MHSLGNGGLPWRFPGWNRPSRRRRCKGSDDVTGEGVGSKPSSPFPVKQAAAAASLIVAGDTIAQVSERLKTGSDSPTSKDLAAAIFSSHDYKRSLRMLSYGFLLYGPGSYAWYQFLDRALPAKSLANLSAKVALNQIVLGPCVISVVFAWNSLWLGQLSQLPKKYRHNAIPTLLNGFRFWIPVSIVNFSVVPLPTRVAFMSTCSIFWNFYLSTQLSK